MSRIPSAACSSLDMEWYGVDKRGNIGVFCSAGEGSLPSFVCENAERTDALIEYFAAAGRVTESLLLVPMTAFAEQVARSFSDRGLYYFDADDGTTPGTCSLHRYYTIHSRPQKPLRFDTLPERIREMLQYNRMDIADFSLEDTIHVKHAYA